MIRLLLAALLLAGCATPVVSRPADRPDDLMTGDDVKMERRNRETCEARGGTYLGYGGCLSR